jgi:hypothetical protein
MKNRHIALALIVCSFTISASCYADAIASDCRSSQGQLITNKKIANYNINNYGYMNIRFAKESGWRSINGSPSARIQDYARIAYLTGAYVDVCISDNRITMMERTYGANE